MWFARNYFRHPQLRLPLRFSSSSSSLRASKNHLFIIFRAGAWLAFRPPPPDCESGQSTVAINTQQVSVIHFVRSGVWWILGALCMLPSGLVIKESRPNHAVFGCAFAANYPRPKNNDEISRYAPMRDISPDKCIWISCVLCECATEDI